MKKVKIPYNKKFIVDWYEKHKDDLEYNIYVVCSQLYDVIRKSTSDEDGYPESRFLYWLGYSCNKPIETLVKMHLFGYELENVPRYTVEIPNPNRNSPFKVVLVKEYSGICLKEAYVKNMQKDKAYHLTEDEIKEDFDWAWQFAKVVEC